MAQSHGSSVAGGYGLSGLFRTSSAAGRVTALGALCVLAACCGCDWWLRITEVSGKVTIDGRPAGGVQLVFEPLDASRPRAFSRTKNDGTFSLGRQGPGNRGGAAAGKYRVKLLSDREGEGEDGTALVIPAEYNTQSTLEFEVVPGRANTFDIDIKTGNGG